MSQIAPPRLLGARVARVEDPRFLLGRATYVGDMVLPRMVHASFVRSPFAHAKILGIDSAAALAMPGVKAVMTGADTVGRAMAMVCDSTLPDCPHSSYPALAIDRVRFVGEAVALIVADDRYLAEDAEDGVDVTYEPLPVVATIEDARREDAPRLHDGWKDNFFIRTAISAGDTDAAFAGAHGTVEFEVANRRHSGIPLECRGMIAEYDPVGRNLTLWTSTQIPHMVRSELANCLGMPENRIRVISPEVGGGFGPKSQLYPEEIAISLVAMQVGRPVKWIEDRREHMLSAFHAREQYHKMKVAYDADGTIRGVRAEVAVDVGAYSVYPWSAAMEPAMAMFIIPGPYRIQNYECEAVGLATNKCPFGAYRGVARSAACFSIERAMDQVAKALGMDRMEVRRRNLIRDEEFPYTSATGMLYDRASLIESLDKVIVEADYEGLKAKQAAAHKEGRFLGIGVATYIEQTAPPADKGLSMNFRWDSATVRMDPSGTVIVQLGTHSHGQGHETTMAQIVADQLAVPLADVRVLFGDTMSTPQGIGTFASRSAVVAGGAAHIAAGKVRDKILEHAAHLLELDAKDLELVGGHARPRGVPSKGLAIRDIARDSHYHPEKFPFGMDPLLEAVGTFDAGPGTYANSSQIILVEVDPDTGKVLILDYFIVEDCGQRINPTIVEGQIHGGIAQGIGGALMEELTYDSDGQLLTTTLLDYLLPSSTDIPFMTLSHLETPSLTSPNGIKGVGEGGAVAPYAIIASAVEDAILHLGEVVVNEVPLTPARVRGFVEMALAAGRGR
jgi:aerobic carbon-monoxide dehydrogenase large subunit